MESEWIEVRGEVRPEWREILTPEALRFVANLERAFGKKRRKLLERRQERQVRIDEGEMPDFLKETEIIRSSDWKARPIPADLQDRRVEITGPVDRKMIINALNSGANVFMADFEDSLCPTWENVVEGQKNLYNAVRRKIEYTSPEGKEYKLGEETAVLKVRPRGWHLEEKNILVNGQPISAGILDFGLFFYHNARELVERGTGPYFYLAKLENRLEARLWNDVFKVSQRVMDIPQGTIKATVLIEHILAAFEMDEIIWELQEHIDGLNCGRWDYIFSYIKTFIGHPEFVVPNRDQITMESPMMKAYVDLLIATCHRRDIHAMGGMAAQIPVRDPEINKRAMDKVAADKWREVKAGHDGTWVAHPGLVQLAKGIFDQGMMGLNQIEKKREDVVVAPKDLLAVPKGTITHEGLRTNIDVFLRYTEAWLNGLGCVPLYNLMEDAATAEITRSEIKQWVDHGAVMLELAEDMLVEIIDGIKAQMGEEAYEASSFDLAGALLLELTRAEKFEPFLTIPAYQFID